VFVVLSPRFENARLCNGTLVSGWLMMLFNAEEKTRMFNLSFVRTGYIKVMGGLFWVHKVLLMSVPIDRVEI
jgi:hypothetical protein